jgi:hypothetical protein
MEAVEPGLPLTFLNSHIQHGNALLGTTPELMAKGIPDAAWDPIEGDDKKTASALKKRNKTAEKGQRALGLFASTTEGESATVTRAVSDLEAASDTDVAALTNKELRWGSILESQEFKHQKFIADAWCAAFVWPKLPGTFADAAPVNELWRQIRDGQGQPPGITLKTVEELAQQYHFFHWHLAFPQVFAKGKFDVVLGNPPWDSLLFREEEFFAGPRPDIAEAPTAAARKRLVAKLETEDPTLFRAYREGLRGIDGINAFVRSGVSYPLCGVGRVNLFALFAEAARALVSPDGRSGQILPSGIVTDDSTKLFFQAIVDSAQLVSFYDFENRERMFPAVDSRMKFGVLSLSGAPRKDSGAEFVFFATRADHIKQHERRFSLTASDIALLNPATRTCPIFRSQRDATIIKEIYRRVPVLTNSGWEVTTTRLLNSADDSAGFLTTECAGALPLYEAKYFHQFDHRWLTVDGQSERALSDAEKRSPNCTIQPRFWFSGDEARSRLGAAWSRAWVLAWRRISNSTNERTFIATVLPSVAVPHTARVIFPPERHIKLVPSFLANLDSFAFDSIARRKVGGTDVSDFIVHQLAVLPPTSFQHPPPWDGSCTFSAWSFMRVLELTYTAWDLAPFAHDVGYDGPPFRWDPERRFLLRCELDAAFFHLYGLNRDDTDYVMDTFPIVRKNDEKAHGEYRTKRVILEIYDAMAEAAKTGKTYQTRLDPPAADARVAHEDTRKAAGKTAGKR